jgi:hypothetical protein
MWLRAGTGLSEEACQKSPASIEHFTKNAKVALGITPIGNVVEETFTVRLRWAVVAVHGPRSMGRAGQAFSFRPTLCAHGPTL